MTLDLLVAGAAWANGFRLDELGYSAEAGPPSPPANHDHPGS